MRPSPRHEGASRPRDRGGAAWDEAPRDGRHRRPRSLRGPRGGRVDRAQRSGASLNTATRGKPLRRGAENLRGPAGDRRPSAAAPFAGTPQGRASQALATARVGSGFKDPTPKRSEAERGVGSEPATGAETDSALGVTWLIYTHIFHYPHNTSAPRVSSPPDSVRGRRPGGASVCGRAGARMMANSEAHCKRKTVTLFTE